MTTDLDKLAELATRCENASGPDREMDGAIARAIGAEPVGLARVTFPRDPADERFARYTASLDAAMSLVPPNCCFEVGNWDGDWARVIDGSKEGFFATAGTPPLALCAASLRALSMMKVGDA